MQRVEGEVAVTFYEGQRLVAVPQQLHPGDVGLHQ